MRDDIFLGLPDWQHVLRVCIRLLAAALLGAALGFERQEEGKAAGLRTHMLVAIGAALFVLAPLEAGVELRDLARIVQGLTMGVGFLGAGTIIKRDPDKHVTGLTTAANLWLTCAVGMAVGIGWIWPAATAVVLGIIILFVVGRIEPKPPESH